ncbi:MAG: hypothetical protein NTW12_13300 [Deltaproteobacteria bacterium]|nr:hypothetical protein [Deltaproteobacteria bacterium]
MENEPSQQQDTSKKEPQITPSPDGKGYVSLTDFFSIVVKIISVLVGFASLFILFGYTIILSFIDKVKLYGITTFPQEFYKEAAIKFFVNMLEIYGEHLWFFTGMIILFILSVAVTCFYTDKINQKFKNVSSFFGALFIMAVIMLTLNLDKFPDKLIGMEDPDHMFLFMFSLPACFGILFYLALNFRSFMVRSYGYYYLMVLMFVGLFLSIPIAYGKSIFDVEVFSIKGIDYAESTKIESLINLKKQIDSEQPTTLFFLMGHTTDKEIFFDCEGAKPPAKMIIMERSLIKFIKVLKTDTRSLREILGESRDLKLTPITSDVTVEDKLPDFINTKINKALQRGVK